MSTEFVCPKCHKAARSPKQLAPGTPVRCPACGVVSPVGEAPRTAMSSTRRPPAKPAQEAPVVAQRDDSPRSSTRRRPARDDYDDDDRPRRGRHDKKSGMSVGVIVALAVVGVLAVAGIVVAVVVLGGGDSKTQVAVNTNPGQPGMPSSHPGGPNPNTRPFQPTTPAPTTKSDPQPPDLGGPAPAGAGAGQDLYDYVLKSTVLIVNDLGGGRAALGTGSVIDGNERLILTNYHVVHKQQHLVVFFPAYENGKLIVEKESKHYLGQLRQGAEKSPEGLITGELIASDPQRDLALIRVPKLPSGTETLPLSKTVLNIGQTVHSVGNPGASGALWVYTQGAVRAVYRKKWKIDIGEVLLLDSEVVETQSPTNHGDSGGPLVNDRGELVGVTEGGSAEGHLISIFISLNEARDFIEREYQRKFGKGWSQVARAPLRIRGGAGGATVAELVSALDHKEAKTRATAAQRLGEMGPDAKLAIRRLLKALKDSDDLVSRTAAEALTKIGAPGRDDLPALLEGLKDAKPEVRRYAAAAIGQIGSDAATAASKLADAMSDQDERVRESLVRSLGSLGSSTKATAMPALTKALQDDSKNVRVAAASSLTNLANPPSAEDVPLLVSILKAKDPEAIVFGARALGKLGKTAKAAVPDLVEAAKNPDAGVRREAIGALATVGPDAKGSVPLFVAALKEGGDSGVRQSALAAIGQMAKDLDKEKDKETVAAVIEATKDSDALVKKAALATVGKMGPVLGAPGAKEVMPAVNSALEGKDTALRDQALETVAGLGPLAKDAVNPLISLLEQPNIKLLVERSSGKVFLQDSDSAYLDKIAKAIGKIGAPAVTPLRRSFNLAGLNFNAGLVIGSCRALGEMGPAGKGAAQQLAAIASNPELPSPLRTEADKAYRKVIAKP